MKRTTILIIILFFLLAALVLFRLKLKLPAAPQTPTTPEPGKTTLDNLHLTVTPYLAKPTGTSTEYYVGDSQSYDHTQYVIDNKSRLLTYYIDGDPKHFQFTTLKDYINTFGEPNFVRYNSWYNYGGFTAHIFLNPGLVIIAQPKSGAVTEVWHIPPRLTPDQFQTQFKDLLTTAPPAVPQNY
jgi:hypothetical protein